VWHKQVQSITLNSNIKSDLMFQILLRTVGVETKATSGEEIKVNMPTTTAGHLVPEFLSFTTDTFKQTAMKKSHSSQDQNLS
jgi:hypothetical protein